MSSNYSDRELHTSQVVSHVMMMIHTGARGTWGMLPWIKNDKNVAIWYILSVPKYVIINLKINNF